MSKTKSFEIENWTISVKESITQYILTLIFCCQGKKITTQGFFTVGIW
jgi:hypothetical protein